jgi:hypothetical protein
MSLDLLLLYLAIFVVIVASMLLTLRWFDHWAGTRLDDDIERALIIANACECGDPNEVTIDHSSTGCSLKPDATNNGV